jgi:acyl-CoA dehydrogenase
MAQDTAELFFNNVKVPKENVLGDAAKGFHYLMESLPEERLICACDALVAAQKAFDLTVEFVSQRKAFGKRIADFQNTQFKLAELRTRLDMLQVYLDHCVASHNEGQLTAVDAAKLKYYATELQGRVVDECLQLHGGAGFMDEYPISRLYTDARITRIFAGTNEIMKLIISREIFSDAMVSYIDRR